jgi:hypothetical protein
MNARSMEKPEALRLYTRDFIGERRLVESIDGKVFADTILALIQDEARLQSMRQSSSSFLNKNALAQIHHLVYSEGNAAALDPAPAPAGSKDPRSRATGAAGAAGKSVRKAPERL